MVQSITTGWPSSWTPPMLGGGSKGWTHLRTAVKGDVRLSMKEPKAILKSEVRFRIVATGVKWDEKLLTLCVHLHAHTHRHTHTLTLTQLRANVLRSSNTHTYTHPHTHTHTHTHTLTQLRCKRSQLVEIIQHSEGQVHENIHVQGNRLLGSHGDVKGG